MHNWMDVLAILLMCGSLSIIAYKRSVLTRNGSISAFIVGAVIGIMGDVTWVILLLIFFLTSFTATRYKFDFKKKRGLQEGRAGERGAKNVLANGAVPVAIAVLSFPNDFYPVFTKDIGSILFLSAIAVAASDTMASELGIFSKRVYLITNRRRVRAGTDGGISLMGQGWAFAAAGYTGILGILMFYFSGLLDGLTVHLGILILLVTFIGFLGCQIDSVIGATLERRRFVSKLSNNLISIGIGTALMWGVLTWIG